MNFIELHVLYRSHQTLSLDLLFKEELPNFTNDNVMFGFQTFEGKIKKKNRRKEK